MRHVESLLRIWARDLWVIYTTFIIGVHWTKISHTKHQNCCAFVIRIHHPHTKISVLKMRDFSVISSSLEV